MAISIPKNANGACWTDIADYEDGLGNLQCSFLALRFTRPCTGGSFVAKFDFFGLSKKYISGSDCDTGSYYKLAPSGLAINHRRALNAGLWTSSFVLSVYLCDGCNAGQNGWIGGKIISGSDAWPANGGAGVVSTNFIGPARSPCSNPVLCSDVPTTKIATFTVYDNDTLTVTSP